MPHPQVQQGPESAIADAIRFLFGSVARYSSAPLRVIDKVTSPLLGGTNLFSPFNNRTGFPSNPFLGDNIPPSQFERYTAPSNFDRLADFSAQNPLRPPPDLRQQQIERTQVLNNSVKDAIESLRQPAVPPDFVRAPRPQTNVQRPIARKPRSAPRRRAAQRDRPRPQ